MRNAFARHIEQLAAVDPRVVLLSGDIGNRMFDNFKQRFPERFMNVGIAEQNMAAMAAGLAMTGLRPYCYTIAPFLIYRCYEQIRVDLCYHNQPVTLVGVGGGLCYAELGATHQSCEDIAVMRALPGMTVLCPADAHETTWATAATLTLNAPAYIRLGKKNEPLIHTAPPTVDIGHAIPLRTPQKTDLAICATGVILPNVLAAAENLAALNIHPAVYSLPTLKPLDTQLLDQLTTQTNLLVTVEEHAHIGGLGAAVAEHFADNPKPNTRILRIATPDQFLHEAGNQQHARQKLGLDVNAITHKIKSAFDQAPKTQLEKAG